MKAIRLALLELSRFRGPLRRLVPVILVLVPLLYGALYLWSAWDPYGKLNRVPVAVVNSDRPVMANNQHIDAGQQFTQQLKATDLFDWHFVRPAEARDGLTTGRYYFTIEVPPDFSAKLATASNTNPQRANLKIVKNDANGYIAGVMADTARAQLQNQVNAAAHATYAKTLYAQLGDIRQKLQLTSGAAHRLVEGSQLNRQGADAMTNGFNGMHGGTTQITDGMRDITAASSQLDQQVSAATDFATAKAPAAVNDLVNASSTAANTLGTVKSGTAAVHERADDDVRRLRDLGQRHPVLAADPAFRDALTNASSTVGAAARADGDAQGGLDAANSARAQAEGLQSNMAALQGSLQGISGSASTVRAGTAQVSTGTAGITGGLDSLASGSKVLQTGSKQLDDGARQLSGTVDDTLARVPPTDAGQVARAASILGSPAAIQTDNLHPAYVYGRGLAPFFFSIALWVFGLFAYLLLRPVNLRALASRAGSATVTFAGWLPAAGLGVVGGWLLFGVVDLALGLNPRHLVLTAVLLMLGAATFVSIDHFLRTALGTIGGMLSVVLLLVQLTACGGLYPMETAPAPFRALHPWIPMTYLVDGLRVTISGGLPSHFLRDFGMLTGFLVTFLLLTMLAVVRHRTWTVGRLHPQIEF